MALVAQQTQPAKALRIRVRGAVQGVGFRPHVYGLAQQMGLAGWVLNDSDGVLMHVEGPGASGFADRLRADLPPLARIDRIDVQDVAPGGLAAFRIRTSAAGAAARTRVPADAAVCDDCLAEICDPRDHRYRYPFTNCTHCGPRYTITRALPYDRAQTSMGPFAMCSACQAEYDDPGDRRFHAQPNACPACGPRLSMPLADIAAAIAAGEIVAVKGLGGFHLAADARNAAAVERLRQRKGRDGKPFAVMVPGLTAARRLADLTDSEAALLSGRARPIVLARAWPHNGLAPGVQSGLPTIGIMLAYTPLQYLLFHDAMGRPDGTSWTERADAPVWVMTSANASGDPLIIDDDEAQSRLSGIADRVAGHDRRIVARADDGIVRQIAGAPAILRRARGHVPAPVQLSHDVPSTLAVGGDLKTTLCLIRGREAFVSPHLGDMSTPAARACFREAVDHLTAVLDVVPERLACDWHPDFFTTRWAESRGGPLVRVQHHHAHVAAVAAEHGVDGPLLGLALDGVGLGEGGSAWGGELLLSDGARFRRLGGLKPLAQPGGDAAALDPRRMAAAALHALGRGAEIARRFADFPDAALLAAMLDKGVNCPATSSTGRLFDAAAGLLGVCDRNRFEGEAAMRLEGLVERPRVLTGGWQLAHGMLDLTPLLGALADEPDARRGAELFHGTLAAALTDWVAQTMVTCRAPRRVALSGGCFHNKVLSDTLGRQLAATGVSVLRPRAVPAGDGGLSLGQAWIAGRTDLTQED